MKLILPIFQINVWNKGESQRQNTDHIGKNCKGDALVWHYRTLLEFDPSSLSIQGLFTRAEIMEGK